MPQTVTHEKVLVGCDPEMKQFVEAMGILGEKLGPMVLQFPFFNKAVFKSQTDFLDRLIPFLKYLPQDYRFAVEIRNREWLDAQFARVLRDFHVALVLQDQSRMPPPNELSKDSIRSRRIGRMSGGWATEKASSGSRRLGTKP